MNLKQLINQWKKANGVGNKVIEGKHTASPDVKKMMEKMKDLCEKTGKLEKEKSEKLDKVLKYLEDMESKSVDFASKSDKLSSLFSTTNSHLSEPISANTSKDVLELKKEIEELEKIHKDQRSKDLDDITKLEKKY